MRVAGVRSSEFEERLAAIRDSAPTVTRCLWCKWRWTGPAGKGREKAREHRAKRHGL